VPNLQSVGRQHGIVAPLLLITSFWIGGCQSPATQSEGPVGSDTRWRITAQAGPVSLRFPGESFWQRAIPGARIAPGSQIAMSDGSRLELASAGDKVTAAGPSRFTLPTAEQNGVRVRQDAGSLRYKVRSAPKRRFEVKTPHFSTVVKGTSFLVSIDPTNSAVVVYEGRVLVVDPRGQPLAELTAGQIGRMAAQPGATFEVSTAGNPTFEDAEPGAGRGPPDHGNTDFPQTTNDTGAFLSAPADEAVAPAAEPSFLERVEGFFGDFAAQLSSAAALTSGPVGLDNERRGRAGDQARQNNDRSFFHGNEIGNGRGGRGDHHKGKGGRARGNGKGKDKSKDRGTRGAAGAHGQSNGKGHDRGNGHSHGRDKGGRGGRAHIILDGDDQEHFVAWSTPQ
jgi:hypothetical protein